MRIVQSANEFVDSLLGAKREDSSSFGIDTILLEIYHTTKAYRSPGTLVPVHLLLIFSHVTNDICDIHPVPAHSVSLFFTLS